MMPTEGIIILRISTEQVTEAGTLLDLYSEDALSYLGLDN
jgi:hypothetical protein